MIPHDHHREPTGTRAVTWRKSSRSEGQTQCVEVADLGDQAAVRDSKNPDGPALLLTAHQLSSLLHQVKTGRHDL